MKDSTRNDYQERLLRAMRHLELHLDEPLSTEDMARVACFSPFHFSRIYAAMTGETVMTTLRRLRMERAAAALRYSDRQITELAFEAGYETLEAFGRGFRRLTGMSPSTYRSRFRLAGCRGPAPDSAACLPKYTNKQGELQMDVTIQKFDDMHVACVRHVGPYQDCCTAWNKLCLNPAVRAGLGPDTLAIGIGYDDPDITDADKIRYDVCVTVPASFKAPDGVSTQTIKGGEFAVLRHVGSYSGLHDCYRFLYGVWLPQSGREPSAFPPLEIYRNDPDNVPEDQLITDICLPLNPVQV